MIWSEATLNQKSLQLDPEQFGNPIYFLLKMDK